MSDHFKLRPQRLHPRHKIEPDSRIKLPLFIKLSDQKFFLKPYQVLYSPKIQFWVSPLGLSNFRQGLFSMYSQAFCII